MTRAFSVHAIQTRILETGDDLVEVLIGAVQQSTAGGFQDGDVLVIAETALATVEGAVIALEGVRPSRRAEELGARHALDPRVVQVVLDESDRVVGGIDGFLLCIKNGTLLPNAGVDASNAPPGHVTPLPRDPDGSARRIRAGLEARTGARLGVLIADSRTHAMRLGSSGVAIGCAGIPSVIDERGRTDLFGRVLQVTKRAVADCIVSAAELVMGEADEAVPAALVRGTGIPIGDWSGVEGITAEECLFMGAMRAGNREE
ncbi:MAG TPA: coenzyme F420-0:L-glutamate ligase [Methanoregulaceae archaeon]|nr:coenzyme F420-0:L-glutamate ligase [Methanoregulaceae archaeon]HQJ88012.1 coenzyme F420-0:L-glutamate ligase [Methanoregulaceae archaeon]